MKQLLSITYFFLITVVYLTAQVELDPDDRKFDILEDYEVSTGKNVDTKSLLKLTRNSDSADAVEFSFEQKIIPSFSLVGSISGVGYSPIIELGYSLDDDYSFWNRFEVGIEGRYYLHQKKLVEGGYGNNVNGLYFSAGIGSVLYDDSWFDSKAFGVFGVGLQSRILRNGILDFSISARFSENKRIKINPNVKAGFALSKDYKNLEIDNGRCNILKCFEEKNFQFKIPLNRLFNFSYTNSNKLKLITFNPRVNFEHKLIKGVSLIHQLSYSNFTSINETSGVFSLINGFGYTNNVRWYVLKARNIAKGKSADNLSGIYAENAIGFYRHRLTGSFFSPNNELELLNHFQVVSFGVNMGYQTRLFKRLYVDCKGSVSRYLRTDSVGTPMEFKHRPSDLSFGLYVEFGFLF